MGYIFYLRKFNMKVIMKLIVKGGFSSKLRIECLVELGYEVCIYCLLFFLSKYDIFKFIYIY